MSRIGKHPVSMPSGVEAQLAGRRLTVKGGLGTLSLAVSGEVTAVISDGTITIAPANDTKQARAMWGTTRALVNNMVTGVSKGFSVGLEINGVGYRAEVKGAAINLSLGYSHPIVYQLPPGVAAKVERQVLITLESADRQLLGTVAAQIRELRPPEPYKGKGIKYATETIRRKAGKAAAGSTSS